MTSLLSRVVAAFSPRADANPLDDRYYEGAFQYADSMSGVQVSRELALRQAVFYRCISIRAQAFAQLPVGVYQRGENKRTEIPDHPLARALDRPNPWQTSFAWRREMWCDILLSGHAYNQILYPEGQGGKPTFIPLDADRVKEITKEGDTVRTYEFTRKSGEKVRLVGDRDVWHMSSMNGRGLVELARETLGLAISTQNHASTFMRRGVKSTGVLEHPGRLKPETATAMSANFNQAYGGQAGHGKIPVLYEGMKFSALSMNNRDAQFAELKTSSLEELATFCGVAPYMVGMIEKQTSWGSGVEEQNLTFIQYTLGPDCILFEQESARVFLDSGQGTNGKYVRMNQSAFLRGRTKDRFDVYGVAIDKHIMTPNECREREDMDPLEGGDEFPAVPGAQMGTAPEDPEDPEDESMPPAKPKQAKGEESAPVVGVTMAEIVALIAGQRAPMVPNDDRAAVLARSIAAELLKAEARDMAEIAKANAGDSGKWANVVTSYHGRRVAVVAASLSISEEQAKGYCKEQARLAVEGGAKALETWAEDHAERVSGLALGPEVVGRIASSHPVVNIHNHPPAQTINVAPAAVSVSTPAQTINLPEMAPTFNVAAAAPAPPPAVQDIRIIGAVDASVSKMPKPHETTTTTTVESRDSEGRPVKVRHESKGK